MDINGPLAIGQIVSLLLFVLSEIIGKSKCKATGVVEFILMNVACSCRNTERVDENVEL